MDKSTIEMMLQIIIVLPIILILIYISLKLGGTKLQNMSSGRYLKIYEKVNLNKESSIFVMKIGEKGFVMSSTSKETKILLQLSEEEISKIEDKREIKQYKNINEFIQSINKKLKGKKEE